MRENEEAAASGGRQVSLLQRAPHVKCAAAYWTQIHARRSMLLKIAERIDTFFPMRYRVPRLAW